MNGKEFPPWSSYIDPLELMGFTMLGHALSESNLSALLSELTYAEGECSQSSNLPNDYLVKQDAGRLMLHNVHKGCPTVNNLIKEGVGVDFIKSLVGDELVCITCTYAHCKPGYQGIPLHTDYDPYANNPYRPNNPAALRIIYYLDETTPAKAPLRIIPYSHLSLHKGMHHDAEFHKRMDGEIELTCPAGTAIVINPRVFHGVGPNKTLSPRRVLVITYRPSWAVSRKI